MGTSPGPPATPLSQVRMLPHAGGIPGVTSLVPAWQAGGARTAGHPEHRQLGAMPAVAPGHFPALQGAAASRCAGLQHPGARGCICTSLWSRAMLWKPVSTCTSGSAKRNYAISPGCAPAVAQAPGTAQAMPGALRQALCSSALFSRGKTGPEHANDQASMLRE